MASDIGTTVNMELVLGEDFAAQIFWTDEYGDPIPIGEPVMMDVKDANGQIAMRFAVGADRATQPAISYSQYGFFQITAPRSATLNLVPGVYLFDLFAAVVDPQSPFPNQVRQVVSGLVTAANRVTRLEDAGEAGGETVLYPDSTTVMDVTLDGTEV